MIVNLEILSMNDKLSQGLSQSIMSQSIMSLVKFVEDRP